MRKLYNESAFTLVEIILSIVILGIIALSIIPFIGNSVVNIIRIGQKDQAVNTASSFTEIIQQKVIANNELDESEWQNLSSENVYYKDQLVNIEYKNCSNVADDPGETKLLFCKSETAGGYKVKVVFYYDDNKRIILNSFVSSKRS